MQLPRLTIPRIDDCIDRVGHAKYVSKIDLLNGYWQVPLTEGTKCVSAFVTPNGLCQYRVMPFGMKNASANFQRLINSLTSDLEGYIDDVVVYSDTWKQHMQHLRALLEKLARAKLTVDLSKSEFGHAQVVFLGHVIGQGCVTPEQPKVESVAKYPPPTSKQELMWFLSMAGYYRKFCWNFSIVTTPLTNLLKKQVPFLWFIECLIE